MLCLVPYKVSIHISSPIPTLKGKNIQVPIVERHIQHLSVHKRVGVTDHSSALQCLPLFQHQRSSTHPGNCALTTSWKSKTLCQSNHSSMQRRWEILNRSHNILIHQLTSQIHAQPFHNRLSSDKWVP